MWFIKLCESGGIEDNDIETKVAADRMNRCVDEDR